MIPLQLKRTGLFVFLIQTFNYIVTDITAYDFSVDSAYGSRQLYPCLVPYILSTPERKSTSSGM